MGKYGGYPLQTYDLGNASVKVTLSYRTYLINYVFAIAKWHWDNGVARVDGVPRDTRFLPHPRSGGARGYDIPFRRIIHRNRRVCVPCTNIVPSRAYHPMQTPAR